MIQKYKARTFAGMIILLSLCSCRSRSRPLEQILEHCPKALSILGAPVQVDRPGAKSMGNAGVWMPPGPGCDDKIPVKGSLASGWVYESHGSDQCFWLDLGPVDLRACHE
jgi:hypothetical protein